MQYIGSLSTLLGAFESLTNVQYIGSLSTLIGAFELLRCNILVL